MYKSLHAYVIVFVGIISYLLYVRPQKVNTLLPMATKSWPTIQTSSCHMLLLGTRPYHTIFSVVVIERAFTQDCNKMIIQ